MKKKISLKVYIPIVVIICILEIVFLASIDEVNSYCENAICNEDYSYCVSYYEDEDGNYTPEWSGSCK